MHDSHVGLFFPHICGQVALQCNALISRVYVLVHICHVFQAHKCFLSCWIFVQSMLDAVFDPDFLLCGMLFLHGFSASAHFFLCKQIVVLVLDADW